MKITKRTETEVRDSLHDAIDRMSIMEIVVLIFLVQMIRTREFVSHVLPKPRKALPAPEKEYEIDWDEVATACTDPAEMNHEDFPEDSLEEYLERVSRAIRECEPYPPLPRGMERVPFSWEHVAPAVPPMPSQMYGIDSNGRYVPVGPAFEPSPPGPSLENPYWVDGGVKIRPSYPEPVWAMCTPGRSTLTGYDENRCNCDACIGTRVEVEPWL